MNHPPIRDEQAWREINLTLDNDDILTLYRILQLEPTKPIKVVMNLPGLPSKVVKQRV